MEEKTIDDFCQKILTRVSVDNWEFSIVFCDDEYIKKLNSDYRMKDEPTDILTFCETDSDWNLQAEETECYYAGDMAVSVETLERNAEYFGVDVNEELKRLLIHGILHLKGMEHKSNDEDDEMISLQEKILKEFGEYEF